MNSMMETRDVSAQVCDQCRKRKLKCDGILPACSNCSKTSSKCAFTADLKRRTKRRGHDPKDRTIQDLQNEVTSLKNQLKTQAQTLQGVYSNPERSASTTTGIETQSTLINRYQAAAIRRPIFDGSRTHEKTIAGPVFRHLGRLVCPGDGVDQFAGSSTGVHFTLSAQTKYQSLFSTNESFPEPVFSLYLATQYPNGHGTGSWRWCQSLSLRDAFPKDQSFYMSGIDSFFENWSYLYPILARKQFLEGIDRIFEAVRRSNDDLRRSDEIILFQMLLILATVSFDHAGDGTESKTYYSHSLRLYHIVTAAGNLSSLQGLLLLLIYYQATAQHHLVYSTMGSVARIAQSLGLHRHARRFKFCIGETEMRKRLWWSVYIFDVMTSLHYGLPKLINNEDDDNDLPADCDFDDITLTHLPLPLPGESTKMSPFLSYIKLAKILSAILKELYTTTRRRNGIQKIEQLTRELQVWESLSEDNIGRFSEVDQDYSQNVIRGGRDLMGLWLHLLGQMALIYIHRPALTFEAHELQFKASLSVCAKASGNVISLLHMFRMDDQLFRLFPSGPNIIFQCGLLCLYEKWHNMSLMDSTSPISTGNDGKQTNRQSEAVEAAAGLLDDLHHDNHSQVSESNVLTQTPSLSQAALVLRHLSTTTSQYSQPVMSTSPHSIPSTASNPIQTIAYPPQPIRSQSQLEAMREEIHFTPESLSTPSSNGPGMHMDVDLPPDFLFGNGNGLAYLNQMDESTWNFLSQMGGYSGEVGGEGLMNYSNIDSNV